MYLAAIQREEEKAKQQLKAQAKKGQKEACTVIAKEILRTRKAVSKIHAAKAQLKSVEYSMNQQLGALQLSMLCRHKVLAYSMCLIEIYVAQVCGCSCVAFYISATIKIAGSMEKSTQVMQSMQQLCKVSDIQASMREMSKEMMKVNISFYFVLVMVTCKSNIKHLIYNVQSMAINFLALCHCL